MEDVPRQGDAQSQDLPELSLSSRGIYGAEILDVPALKDLVRRCTGIAGAAPLFGREVQMTPHEVQQLDALCVFVRAQHERQATSEPLWKAFDAALEEMNAAGLGFGLANRVLADSSLTTIVRSHDDDGVPVLRVPPALRTLFLTELKLATVEDVTRRYRLGLADATTTTPFARALAGVIHWSESAAEGNESSQATPQSPAMRPGGPARDRPVQRRDGTWWTDFGTRKQS